MGLGFKLSGVMSFLLTTSTSFATSIVVPVPCGTPGFRSCSAVLNGGQTVGQKTLANSVFSQVKGATVVTGMITQIQNRVSQQVNCLYQNIDANPLQMTGSTCVGAPFGPLVCDPVANSFNNNTPEFKNDHNGKSCGTPATITLSVQGNAIATNASIDGATSLEYSYLNGGFVQAQSCFMAQVTGEITTANQLTVDSLSPCAPLAQDTLVHGTQLQQNFAAVQTQLAGQVNIQDVDNCDVDWNAIPGDHGRLRQSAQQLCASRTSLETAFTQLAACEIFQRSQSSWIANLGGSSKQNNLFNKIKDINDPASINYQCYNQCKGSADLASGNACSQACYNGKLPGFVGAFIQTLWPTTPTSTNNCHSDASDSIPALAMMGSLVARRKSRRSPRRKKLLQTLGVLIFSLVFFSCANGPASPTLSYNSACPAGMSANYPACSGASNIPGTAAVGGALQGGANAIGAGQTGINQANGLVASSTTGSGLAQAATAGTSALGSGASTTTSPLTTASTTPQSSGASSASGGGSGSKGSASTGINVTTAAAPADPNANGTSLGASEGTALSTSAGGGGGRAARDAGAFNFGALNPVNGLEHLAEEGPGFAGRNIATVGSMDPQDYFTRMQTSDSLFKAVEKTYRIKTTNWVTEDASAASSRVSRPVVVK